MSGFMQLELSLSVICGQLVIGGFYGTELTASFAKAIARNERGGAILFKRNLEGNDLSQVTRLNASLRDACAPDLPPLIGVDQEGGRVARLSSPVLEIPPMRALARAGRVDLVQRAARALAVQLRALGFTMNFAPILDVNTCDENPIIGDRSFGSDPRIVMRFGVAYVRGLQDGGILACGKHFPGHGDTSKDSHHELPVVHHDRARLEQVELLPFRAAAGAGIGAFMTAHVVYDALDQGVPATMSRAICASLLRAEIGFEGALLSDDLEMKAIALRYSIEDAAVEAVWAGCDALLICSDEELQGRAHEALVHRAEQDARFRARCVEAAQRGLRVRRAVRPDPLSHDSVLALVHAPSAVALAKELASATRLPS
jgi:beta-N-acetylhexosaminidase